jgi:hypothetical protein
MSKEALSLLRRHADGDNQQTLVEQFQQSA